MQTNKYLFKALKVRNLRSCLPLVYQFRFSNAVRAMYTAEKQKMFYDTSLSLPVRCYFSLWKYFRGRKAFGNGQKRSFLICRTVTCYTHSTANSLLGIHKCSHVYSTRWMNQMDSNGKRGREHTQSRIRSFLLVSMLWYYQAKS